MPSFCKIDMKYIFLNCYQFSFSTNTSYQCCDFCCTYCLCLQGKSFSKHLLFLLKQDGTITAQRLSCKSVLWKSKKQLCFVTLNSKICRFVTMSGITMQCQWSSLTSHFMLMVSYLRLRRKTLKLLMTGLCILQRALTLQLLLELAGRVGELTVQISLSFLNVFIEPGTQY